MYANTIARPIPVVPPVMAAVLPASKPQAGSAAISGIINKLKKEGRPNRE
jgi:hypothetical protein